MNKFLSCDWGTSSFRLHLVLAPSLEVLAEERSEEGIAACFKQSQEKNTGEEGRLSFYLSILGKRIKSLERQLTTSFEGIPVIISGMASSTIGMMEIPYRSLPFRLDGSDLYKKKIEKTAQFPHDVFIVSGISTDKDVIRGEETQLVGCSTGEDGLFIFPGTHSKHIVVIKGIAEDFKTFMTGEFFELLANKSILSASVKKNDEDEQSHNAFERGVGDSQLNLLNASFMVRTNQLFNKFSKEENYHYLSGLLIGSELKDLDRTGESKVYLIGNNQLCSYYQKAIQILAPGKKVQLISGEEATIKGHYKIYSAGFSA